MTSTKQNGHGVPPSFNASFFCLILFPDQTILMIGNHFCETRVLFFLAYDQRRKIKHGPTKAVFLLHSSYFQTFSTLEIFFSTQIL